MERLSPCRETIFKGRNGDRKRRIKLKKEKERKRKKILVYKWRRQGRAKRRVM